MSPKFPDGLWLRVALFPPLYTLKPPNTRALNRNMLIKFATSDRSVRSLYPRSRKCAFIRCGLKAILSPIFAQAGFAGF